MTQKDTKRFKNKEAINLFTKTGNIFQKRIIQLLKDQHEDFSYLPSLYRIVLNFMASMEKEMATHFSILACRIAWTEEPGVLQSMGSQRVGHTEQLTLSLSLSRCFMPTSVVIAVV